MTKPTNQDRFFMQDRTEITKQVSLGRTLIIPGEGLTVRRMVKNLAAKHETYFFYVYEQIGGNLKFYGYAIPR